MNRLVSKDVSDNIIASSVMALSSMQNMSTKLLSYKDANNVTVGFTGCLIPVKMGDYWGLIDTATDVHRTTDLDTGSIAAATAYYVYSVTNGSAISFKTSVSSSAPTGYSTSTSELLGGFTTDGSSNIDSATVWDVKTKIHNLILATPDIDGGTVDGATIATSNITVGAGKTLDVSAGTLTLADNQISGDKVEGGTIAAITITALTTTTQADNNSSTLPATTAYAKSQDAVLAREPNQGVYHTAAAVATTNIADDDDIDFGTGDFTVGGKFAIPDWTPSANQILIQKLTANVGYQLEVVATTGYIKLTLNTTAYTSSAAPTITDGTAHDIIAVVDVGAVNTTVDFYVDGVVLGAQQTAANPGTVSSAAVFYILGTSAAKYAGTVHHAYTFNRALTAAEVLDLYRNGIAEADKWGSQTEKITDEINRSFSGAGTNHWVDVNCLTFDRTNDLSVTFNASSDYAKLEADGINGGVGLTYGKKYRIKYDAANTFGSVKFSGYSGNAMVPACPYFVDGVNQTFEFTWNETTANNFIIVTSSGASSGVDLDNISIVEIGATLALEPEGIQPAPGQWLDASTNKLHAMQPATGSSLTRYKKTGEIRWTNTWAGTHEAQYIGGINQAILPANCYIESIVGVVSGATIEDIIVGDGSDTDHWVEITTGLAAGTYSFAIANRISDGTNYKMVVDPDANFTGSIIWTIKYSILEA